MSKTIAVLPGDGIGQEVCAEAIKIIDILVTDCGLDLTHEQAAVGGTAFDTTGTSLPPETLDLARRSDAILLGAVGGPQYDNIERSERPERALLKLRSDLKLFSNLRPAILFEQLADASTLKREVVAGLDIMIVRELTGGIYFGEPRGFDTTESGERRGYNTLVYSESEIERIVRSAFDVARQRDKRLCSVDKANVLEVSELWRETANRISADYTDVELSHMYVDNAAMQLVRDPKQFDVIVTTNMFGDILSDAASMLTGSIGMLPSASLDSEGRGLYEPVHGTAPDIAGQNKANPLAMILSVAMMMRYSLDAARPADLIEKAVAQVLDQGLRTPDLGGTTGTTQMGDAVAAAILAST